jgi:tetratricopeptide (TPR) repeat protein
VVLHGLGGVGKTQLALRYLTQRRRDYPDGCFWLRADRATTLVGDLASLSWRITPPLPEREETAQERQVEAVLRWLREHASWLLVLDNLDQPAQDAVRHWLPPGLTGHMIVTSRSRPGGARLGLEPLPLEIAASFLLERTGQADAAAARAIGEALGGLPLALEQAAAYLTENDWHSLADYAQAMRTRMAALLREGKPDDYPLPVASTWDVSFQRLEQEQPEAADLLRLCAFLAPDDIPLSALRTAAGELPDRVREVLEDEVGLDHALAVLRRYSLLERRGDGLRVHRLVQWVVRESLGAAQAVQWLDAAVRLLAAVMPGQVQDPEQWPRCARLLPHAQAVLGLMDDRVVQPEVTAWLLDRIATYLQLRGEYALAIPLFERALAFTELVRGPDDPDTGGILNNLAGLLQDRGRLVEAGRLYERALAISERVLGPDHPNTVLSLGNLASLLIDRRDLAGAGRLYERALAIRERTLGPDHPDTAMSLDNLAGLRREQGELVEAGRLYERALAIRVRLLGADHPDTARSFSNLARLLQTQGDLAAARLLYERALAVDEAVYGPDHPEVASNLNNLASLLQNQGELAEAGRLYERALAIRERVLGPDHPDTALSLNNLGVLLYARSDDAAARARFERALAIRENVLGPDHRETADSLHSLATVFLTQGDLAVAGPLFARALSIRERVLGPDHPDTASSRRRLALIAAETERATGAE